jgi:hypothetical protein
MKGNAYIILIEEHLKNDNFESSTDIRITLEWILKIMSNGRFSYWWP